MAKKMTVDGTEIAVVQLEEKDYISLTDMVRNIENGLALIEKLNPIAINQMKLLTEDHRIMALEEKRRE